MPLTIFSSLQNALSPAKQFKIWSKDKQVIYLSSSISIPYFKTPAKTLFETSCWQIKHDEQMDEQTNKQLDEQRKSNMPFNFSE